jgi:hypothetical protein
MPLCILYLKPHKYINFYIVNSCRIWGFHSGGYEEYHLLGYDELHGVISQKMILYFVNSCFMFSHVVWTRSINFYLYITTYMILDIRKPNVFYWLWIKNGWESLLCRNSNLKQFCHLYLIAVLCSWHINILSHFSD